MTVHQEVNKKKKNHAIKLGSDKIFVLVKFPLVKRILRSCVSTMIWGVLRNDH